MAERCTGQWFRSDGELLDAWVREDPVQIMEILCASAEDGRELDQEAVAAVHRGAWLLAHVSADRLRARLLRLLRGEYVLPILLGYPDVICQIVPELRPCVGFDQNNRYHQYTVYDHIAHAVANYKGEDDIVNMALLLHDVGKPSVYTVDEEGNGHFYGHVQPSRDLAEVALDRLRFDVESREKILTLVLYHDTVIEPTPRSVRRVLRELGKERMGQLMEIRFADILAHKEGTQQSRLDRADAVCAIMWELIAEDEKFSVRDLAVTGNDLMAECGFQEGPEIGSTLRRLMDLVVAGDLPNNRAALLRWTLENGSRDSLA